MEADIFENEHRENQGNVGLSQHIKEERGKVFLAFVCKSHTERGLGTVWLIMLWICYSEVVKSVIS